MKRKNIILIPNEEDSEFALTIMYPMSNMFDGKIFALIEDSFGDVDLKIMTPEAVAKNFDVSLEEINKFIDEVINENKEK